MADPQPRYPLRPLEWPADFDPIWEALGKTNLPCYVVGGSVRDGLLGRPIHDLDIAVPTSAIRTARRLADQVEGKLYILDQERDVARVLAPSATGTIIVDIARYRSSDLSGDLADRDFTINAIACDVVNHPDQIIDPHDGEADLIARKLRRCSPDAIASDPVRILRAVRLSAELGFQIERETRQDCLRYRSALQQISPERKRDEFFKLLGLDRASAGMRALHHLGVLDELSPELARSMQQDQVPSVPAMIDRVRALTKTVLHARGADATASFQTGMFASQTGSFRQTLIDHMQVVWADGRSHLSLLSFMILFVPRIDLSTPGEYRNERPLRALLLSLMEPFRLSNDESQRVVHALAAYTSRQAHDGPLDRLAIHRYWYRYDRAGIDGLLLWLAAYLAQGVDRFQQDKWLTMVGQAGELLDAMVNHADTLVNPALPVNGDDLMRHFAIPRGPVIGRMLTAVREAVAVGSVVTSEAAYSLAEQILSGTPGENDQGTAED
jgi:hypothetical protein